MRSLYLNLKDKSNPVLRASVISGEIDGKLLWSMSSADMASAEKKAQLAEFSKAALFSAQGAAPKKAETDMFECGKCKKRKATYYQMQTRSADEVSPSARPRARVRTLSIGSVPSAADDYIRHLPQLRQ